MEQNKQYLRYKDSFKKQCIVSAIASVCALLTIIFLVFIPCFRMQLTSNLLGEQVVLAADDFSFLDEIKMVFKNINFSGDPGIWMLSIFSIMEILALLFLAVGVVMLAVDCVKSIVNIKNLENYALAAYDDIKSKTDQTQKNPRKRFPAAFFVSTGIMVEIFSIIFTRIFVDGMDMGEFLGGYFIHMTGVTGLISIVIVCAVAFIAMTVFGQKIKNKLKMEILKEDYGLQE